MGGPNHLDEVSLFLNNMFHDKNILTIRSTFIRSLLAHLIVKFRLKKAIANYQAIGGKSPITQHTQRLITALQELDSECLYTFAMSYTPPFIKDVLALLQAKHITEIVLFSLYPQYSTTTTLTSLEQVKQACHELSYQPHLTIIDRYYDDSLYNEAIIERITEKLSDMQLNSQEVTLIFSAHGLPQKVVQNGDPYVQEVLGNIEVLKSKLSEKGLVFKEILHAFQSHLGPVKWTEPFLADVLAKLKGKSVLIYPIAFTIDNSETDFELSIEYKQHADAIGLKHYGVCTCLNDSSSFVKAILALNHSHKG